ncbi:MAG: serine/threonine protein kinase [Myxococcales bacterium]|nr:serine/threonine protein kinase [Myxococcales bacterium]
MGSVAHDDAVPEASALPELPSRYAEVSMLGEGEPALTLAAYDQERERPVVLKVLELGRVRDWKALERFERECAVLQSLDHPGVPAYLEHTRDESRGQVRLVMERVEGRSLADDLAQGRRRTEAQLMELLDRLLDVLDYLHGLHPPVVHRDIKPSNVVVRPDGRPVLVDFGGVAKVFQPKGSTTVVGTFGYMAPEQLYGRVTPACDLYALGATLAALAAGEEADQLPRDGLEVDLGAVMTPGILRTVLQALLRADPQERPASVGAVRALLARLERGEPVSGDLSVLAASGGPLATPAERGVSAHEGSSLSRAWHGLSPRRRRVAIGYVWAVVGLVVVTRAFALLFWGLLVFPVVLGALHGLGRRSE